MRYKDVMRFLEPLKKRIFLLVGRAVLAAINNTGSTQRVQVVGLYGETITDAERFQEYGLESHPWEDSQAAILFPNGNRDSGIIVAVHDRRYRPLDLAQGEVCLYTDEDTTTTFRIQMKRGRIVSITSDEIEATVDTQVTVTCPQIALGDSWASVKKLVTEEFVSLFNAHVHSTGNGDTGVSTTTMGDGHMTTKTKAI